MTPETPEPELHFPIPSNPIPITRNQPEPESDPATPITSAKSTIPAAVTTSTPTQFHQLPGIRKLTKDSLESPIPEDFSEHPNNATEALELVLDSSQEVSDPSITPLTLSPSIIPLAKPAEKSAAIASSLISSHTLGTKKYLWGSYLQS